MTAPSELEQVIQQYETALKPFTQSAKVPHTQVLEVLTARDKVQAVLEGLNTSDNLTLPSSDSLAKLSELDKILREKAANTIVSCTHSAQWRASFNPNEKAWWWFLENRFNWFYNGVSIACLTVSVGLIGDIAPRFLTGTPDTFGAITVSVQSILTLLAAGGILTKTGQDIVKRWPYRGVLFSILLMSGLIGMRYFLPQIATFYTNSGIESRKKGDWGSAEEKFKRAIHLNADDAKAHFQLGNLYEDLQMPDKARPEYQLAIEGGIPEATNNLARLDILKKQYPAAVSLLLKTLDSEKKQPLEPITKHAVLKNLGWARLMQKNYPDAKAQLIQAINLEIPKNKLEKYEIAASHCLLAQVREAQGDKKGALTDWNTCNKYANMTIPEQDEWRVIAQERLKPKISKDKQK